MSNFALNSSFLFIQFLITLPFTCLAFSTYLRGEITINQAYLLFFICGFIVFLLLSFCFWFAYYLTRS